MADIELLKYNLAIEPDLQNFVGFVLTTVQSLGGNSFAATTATLEIAQGLRVAGAGSGYPLPAELRLNDATLSVHWNDHDEREVVRLAIPPGSEDVERLRKYLRQSTEIHDPRLLLRRNAEMTRYLNETRARTEKEIDEMQQTLSKKQEELSATMRKAETDQLTGLCTRRGATYSLITCLNASSTPKPARVGRRQKLPGWKVMTSIT